MLALRNKLPRRREHAPGPTQEGGSPMQDQQPTGPNPSGLCMCGCGETTRLAQESNRKWGDVKGTPRRYLKNHHTRKSGVDYVEEDRGHETPCWVWQRSRERCGYGHVRKDGRLVPAHRVYYERQVGPIPEGLELDHLCRVRACVNPDHLEPVTMQENRRRAAVARRAAA